ncbi:MAG: glycosyltransferase family 2 protein [Janthinobacterium lividum]
MQISILIPAYARPSQLGDALASIAQQDRSLIGEILIGDDSPSSYWDDNRAVIAASGLAALIVYEPSEPSRGTYPNQWFLANEAKCDYLLLLHNDDQLCPGALALLAKACTRESDERVKLWFGTQWIFDEAGVVDGKRSAASDRHYGRDGPEATKPVWEWCLTEAIPSNSFLVEKATYRAHMQGERDGNIGDWAFSVRLANSGTWAHFIGEKVSLYRVQAGSVTVAGRGVDVHRAFEAMQALRVPADREVDKRRRFESFALVAAVRYARDGERLSAWNAWRSSLFGWRQRFSKRSLVVLAMLMTPRLAWRWALTYKN